MEKVNVHAGMPRAPAMAAWILGALVTLFPVAASAATAIVTDGKGSASARLMFKIVIPPVVVIDRNGVVHNNDRHPLMPVASTPKPVRTDARAVVALP